MSEYCYLCMECGNFREDCVCKRFQDPMERFRNMSREEVAMEMRGDIY